MTGIPNEAPTLNPEERYVTEALGPAVPEKSDRTAPDAARRERRATTATSRWAWLGEAHTSDFFTIGILTVFIMSAVWLRFVYDNWLGEFDILTMFIPWFGYVGQRLGDFEIPAWSPHYFSGAPVVGNPSGGWMYLPVMLLYPVFQILTATKLLLLTHAVIAAAAVYAFSRRIGLAPLAALMSSSIFVLGEVIYGATNYMTIGVQASTWLVVGLLGAEMSLRATRLSAVLGWTALSGVAISQMFVAWPGQGVMYGVAWIGGWLLYRCLFDGTNFLPTRRDRLWHAVLVGSSMIFFALSFGAAGILPIFDFMAESTIPNGDYQYAVGGDYVSEPHGLLQLLGTMLHGARNPLFSVQSEAFGMSVMLLAIFAVFRARRQYGTPFFALMFVLAISLMVKYSPTLWLFEQIPLIGRLHEHRPAGLSWMIAIAPAMLAGAAVQKLLDGDRKPFTVNQVFGLLLLLMTLIGIYSSGHLWAGWWPVLTGAAALLVYVMPSFDVRPLRRRWPNHMPVIASWLLIGIVFLYPTGADLVTTVLSPETDVGGITLTPGKEPPSTWAIETSMLRRDPGSAAEFLQNQQRLLAPFRYTGYAGQGYPDPNWIGQENEGHKSAYSWRRLQQGVVGILVNGRSMRLGLYQTSGYNPVQLRYYAEYFDVMNGRRQDYHWLDTFQPALDGSQLLDMLNVKYIVVDRSISEDRADYVAISSAHKEVFRDNLVVVFENETAFQHAWIVHDVRNNQDSGFGLRMLASGNVDGGEVAYVNTEGDLPSVAEPADGGAGDSVTMLRYAPETIVMSAKTSADGLLVVSDPYAIGWNAYVDGQKVDILRTNHALRGVPITAGEHTVELKYEPRSLEVGLWMTGASAVAMIGIWAWALVDWRRRGTTSAPATGTASTNGATSPDRAKLKLISRFRRRRSDAT